jgi:hypothetical protein
MSISPLSGHAPYVSASGNILKRDRLLDLLYVKRERYVYLPDSRPEPISARELGSHLYLSVSNIMLSPRCQSRTPNGVDHHLGCDVAHSYTGSGISGGAHSLLSEIQCISIQQLVQTDISRATLCCECRNNMQAIRVCISILCVVCSPIERADAESTDLELVVPVFCTEAFLEIILEN